jgi:hypothetical protein
MTFNDANAYCKTGTNGWNGTLVAWRDYETQLAVEQYFFVSGRRAMPGLHNLCPAEHVCSAVCSGCVVCREWAQCGDPSLNAA